MSFRFGKYNCSRPVCQIVANQNGDVSLVMTIQPGQHGNDSSDVEHVTFTGKIKIEGKVVTFEWKDCTFLKGNSDDEAKSSKSRIKVDRSVAIIAPTEDAFLITGALPHESQGQSHGGYRFRQEQK